MIRQFISIMRLYPTLLDELSPGYWKDSGITLEDVEQLDFVEGIRCWDRVYAATDSDQQEVWLDLRRFNAISLNTAKLAWFISSPVRFRAILVDTLWTFISPT